MNRITPICTTFIILIFTFACGENSDTITGPSETTTPTLTIPTMATFSSIQSTVINPSCATSGCHNGTQRPNLLAGSAYDNIVNVQSSQNLDDYIEPGNPSDSYLYRKLTGVNISNSRMPRGSSALAQATLDSIEVWIEKGAFNN